MEERKVWIEVTVQEAQKINDGCLTRPLNNISLSDLIDEFIHRADSVEVNRNLLNNRETKIYIIDKDSMQVKLEVTEE